MGQSGRQQTVTQEIDPAIRQETQNLLGDVNSYMQGGGGQVAPFNPTQRGAFDFLTQRLGAGAGIGQAQEASGVASDIAGGGNLMQGIEQFQDPFTDQVVDRSLGDLDRARQLAMGDVQSQATAAGAFGGSRHGLVEAETNRAFADTAADTAANLRSQGFRTAADLAGRDINQRLAGAGLLSQAGGDELRRTLMAGRGLMDVGNIQQQQAQRELDQPRRDLAFRRNFIFGAPGSRTQTVTQPGNRGAGIFGGALSGASVASGLEIGGSTGNPLAAGIGAGLGGLLGLL